MNDSERIRIVIADFLKISPEGINEHTAIDRSAISNSILIHRMYARLAKEGFVVKNRSQIKTYGQLLTELNLKENGSAPPPPKTVFAESILEAGSNEMISPVKAALSGNFSLGIDIEDIEKFPAANDYRQEQFYKENFSSREISYCILQPEPLQSFAGKFAAKEAVVKANVLFKDKPFNQIEIMNDENGKPVFQQFILSISHTKNQAIAMAIEAANYQPETLGIEDETREIETEEMIYSENEPVRIAQQESGSNRFLSILAILLSLTAIAMILWEKLF